MDSSVSPTKCRSATQSSTARLAHAAQMLTGCSTKTARSAFPPDSATCRELKVRAALLTRCAPLTGVPMMENATLRRLHKN
jgi:hypothetical protein